jgi:hypothetical protein
LRTVGAAVDAFLARGDLAASSWRSYAQTLNRLAASVGADWAIGTLVPTRWTVWCSARGAPARRRRGIVMSRPCDRSSRSAGAAVGALLEVAPASRLASSGARRRAAS